MAPDSLHSYSVLRLVLAQRTSLVAVTRPGSDSEGELCAHVCTARPPRGSGALQSRGSGGSTPSTGAPPRVGVQADRKLCPTPAPGDGDCPQSIIMQNRTANRL